MLHSFSPRYYLIHDLIELDLCHRVGCSIDKGLNILQNRLLGFTFSAWLVWSSANEDINFQSISVLTPTDFCSDRPIFRQFRQEIENTFCLNHCHKFEWERFRCELMDHYGSTHHHLPARSWDKDSISSHILWKYDWILNLWGFYEIRLFLWMREMIGMAGLLTKLAKLIFTVVGAFPWDTRSGHSGSTL